MRKIQIRSEKTQQAILQATMAVARKRGWQKTSIKEICKQADVSIGAFYHHFKSKQDVINKSFLLFDETLDDLFAEEKNSNRDCSQPRTAIKKILLLQTDFIVTKAGPLIKDYYLNILNDANHAAVDPDRKYYRAVYSCINKSSDSLNPTLVPEEATDILIKYVRGSIIDWCLHEYSYDLIKKLDHELDLLLAALFAQESSS